MARRTLTEVVRYLQHLTDSQGGSGLSDAELLERYVRHRDQAAFELLLWRHGTLVLNVCRRVLRHEDDAEDAFQATFLAFVRKAPSISRRGSVAGWLYKVAYRVALEAKARAQKTAQREKAGGESLAIQPPPDPTWNELRPILDEEIHRLPERLRLPLVLCYLEGKTNEEAARELGCRLGTIWSRLTRGREALRNRLLRRGVTLSSAVLTAALAEHAAEASLTVPLIRAAVGAALSFAGPSASATVSPRVAGLAEGVLRTMFVTKLKMAALALFIVGLLAAGGVLTQHALNAAPRPEDQKEPPAQPKAARKAEDKKIAVRVVEPIPGGLAQRTMQRGQVFAFQQQQVVPLISGTVKELSVDIGDRVKKGQLLLVLDAPLVVKEAEEAAAALEIAQAREQEAEAQVAVAQAELDASRGGTLADRRIKEAKVLHAKAALKAANAGTRMARAAAEKARVRESFTRLTADFDGVVTRRTADAGDFVQASDSRLLRPLLTVQRLDRVRVVVYIPEGEATLAERDDPVDLDMSPIFGLGFIEESDLPVKPFPAQKVARFSHVIEGGKMRVEIDVDNPKHRLLPGMAITATVHFNKTRSLKAFNVPASCVLNSDEEKGFVYIVRDGKAHRTPVKVGRENEEKVEILEGVKASDLLVTDASKLKGEVVPVEVQKAP